MLLQIVPDSVVDDQDMVGKIVVRGGDEKRDEHEEDEV